jgi:glutamyl-tRNA synthetase
MDSIKREELAEILFPHINKTPEYYEDLYPKRDLPEEAKVVRLAPSPTGFIHLGNLYVAFANERLAHRSGGIFYLRIEDTDDKREVEGAAEALISSLDHFGLNFDEGVTAEGESGGYGPYYQSLRGDIYQCFVKKLVCEGKAYPCFLTEDEIDGIRKRQEADKLTPGIYGAWATHRDLTFDEVKAKIDKNSPYVMRFLSEETEEGNRSEITVVDGIRGSLTMPANIMDVVILKTNGLPTYHFAHAVDDHLMRTTHVIRGEEWLSSLPVHAALFKALDFQPPVYCHTTVLMKMDGETKRKLSKRKDPELSLDYYRREGYHPVAVREYLLTILNSNYEEWRMANPDSRAEDFDFTTEKMSNSGILFDLDKLRDVSKDNLLRVPAGELAQFLIDWARYARPDAAVLYERDRAYLERILDIGRLGEKPRKDLEYGAQILEFTAYFYDEFFSIEDEWPENVPAVDVPKLLEDYLKTYDHGDDQPTWFDKIRRIAGENGYAEKPKDFKKSPELFKGHVGDVSTVVRMAVMGRRSSPDLWEIQQILGEERVRTRVRAAIGS